LEQGNGGGWFIFCNGAFNALYLIFTTLSLLLLHLEKLQGKKRLAFWEGNYTLSSQGEI